jgi:hypothetical protein
MAHLSLIKNQSLTYLISEKKTFQNFPNFGFVIVTKIICFVDNHPTIIYTTQYIRDECSFRT